jgi:hypothetical protein
MAKIFTIASVPDELLHDWLQHLRDFDVAHPGCHFEVAADTPDMPLSKVIELLQVNPGLDFQAMIEILAQIRSDTAPKFTAGIVLFDDVVVEAAPLVHYMKRGKWTRERVRRYCAGKGWDVSVVHQIERSKP